MQEELEHFYKEPSRKEWAGFWTLVTVQAVNAFNEKAVQFLLSPLGVWLWGTAGSDLEYFLGAIFVLPYILFSPLVGWLADCFCKTRIIQVMSLLQIVVMSCMLFCFYKTDMRGAIIWFAVFATQATILSPAKKGIVKDLLGSRYIGFGSGIIEISLVFVLLLAQIGVFFWFSYLLDAYSDEFVAQYGAGADDQVSGWRAVRLPTMIFIGIAAVVAICAFVLPRYPVKPNKPFAWSLFYEHFVQVKYLWKDRDLRLSELGIAYFWSRAGSLFLILIQIAKEMSASDPTVDFSMQCGILMAWLGGGVVLGGGVASLLCRGKNELGLIPFGAIGITISTFMLTILEVDSLASNIFLTLTGAFGAAYMVPLNAFLQDNCDPANRGNIIAAGNLIDNLMGLVAVIIMWLMNNYGAGPRDQFLVLFLLSAFIMVTSLRLIPQEFIRMVGIWFMKFFYRPRVINADRIPPVGGALIVCNHVTYADALFLTMVCPRPIRFVVAEEFMAAKLLGWLLEIFNSVPISSSNPRDAINKAARGIENGDLICIFPEGQLTRTGCLTPIRRGMEIIARRAHAPIIPMYMDGVWGSIFSFYRNRFFYTLPFKLPRHLPYSYTVIVGEPMHEDFNSAAVLSAFRSLSAECLDVSVGGSRDELLRLLEHRGRRPVVHWHGGSLSGFQVAGAIISRQVPENCPELPAKWLEKLIEATRDLEQLHRLWLNVEQVRRVNALKEGRHRLLTTVGHGETHETVLAVLWPLITRTPVHLIESVDEVIENRISQIVGSTHMRRILLKAIPPRQMPFYDFSNGPDIATPNMRWRPCYATPGGVIISMSTVQSVFKLADGTIQLGVRPRTRGLLLPCFRVQGSGGAEDGVVLSGPSLSSPYTCSSKLYLDEIGFLKQLF
ncbi:MAG: MFS transporter [Akkermansia sp.]|nr:MFS transporter [Akkermansia sp.]